MSVVLPPAGLPTQCELALPVWLPPFLEDWRMPLATPEARMALAVALAAENVRQGSGGPFGAVVVAEADDRLVGVGVNRVTGLGLSVAHAEIMAISLAQVAVADWNLASAGPLQLVTSCEPCAMCFGAVPWSGVNSLICGASREDAEAAGFDEGDKPADWVAALERRGIRTSCGVLRDKAAAVLTQYAQRDGAIYHPGPGLGGPVGESE
jgi:tRNA(Arg) A34 adenosine deaminase TadA